MKKLYAVHCEKGYLKITLCMYVCVQKLQFVTELLPMKQFSEARFDEGPPFKLILKDSLDSDEHIWFATISKGNRCTQLELFLVFAS